MRRFHTALIVVLACGMLSVSAGCMFSLGSNFPTEHRFMLGSEDESDELKRRIQILEKRIEALEKREGADKGQSETPGKET